MIDTTTMKNPRKGLHFGEIVTYESDYDDSRTPVIHEDGSPGWCKPRYIDDIGDVNTPVHKIRPKAGDILSWVDGESGQRIEGKIVGLTQDEKTFIVIPVKDDDTGDTP